MKRFAAIAFICCYLSTLSWGIVSHAVKYKVGAHPAMYFVVWDMFCGWSAYSTRTQVIAQGESGQYYQVSPAPWGELHPFGSIERRHYDTNDLLMPRLIQTNLKNTAHEPISTVYVVEELWPKKFNLPDELWEQQFNEPKDVMKYYNVRSVHDADGTKIQCRPNWFSVQLSRSVSDNPRLQKQAQRTMPFFSITPAGQTQHSMAPNAN